MSHPSQAVHETAPTGFALLDVAVIAAIIVLGLVAATVVGLPDLGPASLEVLGDAAGALAPPF